MLFLTEATCCPGPRGGGAPVRSRRLRNRAPLPPVTPARPGTLGKKRWGSRKHPHRTGEGHAGGTWGHFDVGWGPTVRKSQWTMTNGCVWSPCTGCLWPCLESIHTWRGLVSGGSYDWSSSLRTPPALSPGPQGLPGHGENSCRPRSPQVWLVSSAQEPQVGTGSCHLHPQYPFTHS